MDEDFVIDLESALEIIKSLLKNEYGAMYISDFNVFYKDIIDSKTNICNPEEVENFIGEWKKKNTDVSFYGRN